MMIKAFFQMIGAGILVALIVAGFILLIMYAEQKSFYTFCKVFGQYNTMSNEIIYCSVKKPKKEK